MVLNAFRAIKQAGVTTLFSGTADNAKRQSDHYKLVKGTIQQEMITIYLCLYIKCCCTQHYKTKSTEQNKRQSTIRVRDLNASFSQIHRTTGQKNFSK